MELEAILKKQKKIVELLIEGRIASALPLLSEIVYSSHQGDYISSLENLENTYRNILKYSFGQTTDPQRNSIYNGLKRQMIELCDDVVLALRFDNDTWLKSRRKEDEEFLKLSDSDKSALIDSLASEKEFSSLLDDIGEPLDSQSETSIQYSQTLNKIFDELWISGNYSEGEIQLTKRLLDADGIPVYDKSLIISGVSISLFNHFDLPKLELLFDTYSKAEVQISQRALVGIIFSLLIYQNRLPLYPEITNRLKTFSNPEQFAKQSEQILIQLIKAQETEKVTEKIQKEIIPEVMKLKPDIEDKLRLDDLLSKDDFEDKNPDWENFFSDSPDVYKKLEEFSMMQMDGSDVFMGAFSMLKRFGFFENVSNWFLPFYKEHPEILKSISGVDEKFDWKSFFEGIEKAPVMCNSDKYSFCFNLGFMPDMQKSMMLEMFSMELKQMSEVSEDENKHDANSENKIIFTQYIQDLYRFYKLHPQRKSFRDIFDLKLNIIELGFLNEIFFNTNSLRKIGEFYFDKNYYSEALAIFDRLLEKEQSFELIEKSGFCSQQIGDFKEAIKKYKQAEMFDTNRTWLQKKIGFCYRKSGDFNTAIEYYKKVEITDPENLEIQAYLGQLHIEKEDFDSALKYYFKVEYLKPNFVKALRPIGWCSLVLKKPEQAVRYFLKVVDSDGKRSDFLNLAHSYWTIGSINEAVENYRLAIKHSGNDEEWYRESMQQDSIYLKSYGLDELEIALMTDYILLDI